MTAEKCHCCRPAGGGRRKPETYDQQSDSGAWRRESGGKVSPGLGEHNDEVFKELGFELSEIERLSANGLIATAAGAHQGSIGDQIAFNIL